MNNLRPVFYLTISRLRIVVLFVVAICWFSSSYGQAYVSNTIFNTNIGNEFPFQSNTVDKVEMCYGANDFNKKPFPGLITEVYFRFTSVSSTTYSNFRISMTQLTDSAINKTKSFTPNLQTVYGPAKATISPIIGQWYGIRLTTPFFYDPFKVLIVVVEQNGYSGSGETVSGISGNQLSYYRIYGSYGSSYGQGSDKTEYDFGFDLTYGNKIVEGIDSLISPSAFCASSNPQNIIVRASNYGTNELDSVNILWSFDRIIQTPVSGIKIPAGHDTGIFLGTKIFLPGASHTLKCWMTNPNSAKDTFLEDDTLLIGNLHPDSTVISIKINGPPNDSIVVPATGNTVAYKDPGIVDTGQYNTITIQGSFYDSFPNGMNINKPGTYSIMYYVTDKCGNIDSAVRTVKVADHTPPVINLKGSQIANICRWATYQDSGYTVSDNLSEVQNIRVDTFGTFITNGGTTTPGFLYLKYKAIDQAGNVAYSQSRNIYVIPDTEGNCISGIAAYQSFDKYVSVYPNPGSGLLNVSLRNPVYSNVGIVVVDAVGREIYRLQSIFQKQNYFNIDLTGHPNGIYFINISSGNETTTRKVIIDH